MKLISFDIGIKNMAYCIANHDENLNLISLNKIDLKINNKETTINTYFKMIHRYEAYDIETTYLSPKHKLNIINKYQDKMASSSYKQNKMDAIYFTKYLLENTYKEIDKNSSFLNIYQGMKKKDDISDAFLMIIYYYEFYLNK